MNYDERYEFYLGDNLLNQKFNIAEYPDKKTINDCTENINEFDLLYDLPLKKLLIKTNNIDKFFYFRRGDIISKKDQHMLCLSKNRYENSKDSIILRCLNFKRHWGNYYQKPKDIKFEKKTNMIFWRGTSTGCSQHFTATEWNPRPVNRFTLLNNWFNKDKKIDIGFSKLHRNWLKEEYSKYVKGKCKISKFLKHKYILSLEGNDKDSGLNWKLNSNSLVLMPKPRVTSWLMETTLIPNYHYILLRDDFNDLREKLKWCDNHQNKCKEIIKNANTFMRQFSNIKQEELLEINVINKYFSLINV